MFNKNDNKLPFGEFRCTTLPLDGLCCKRGCKKLTLFSSGFPLSGINSAQHSLRQEISRDYLILSGIHAMLMKLVLFSLECFSVCRAGRGRCCALETSAQCLTKGWEKGAVAHVDCRSLMKKHRQGEYRTSCQRQNGAGAELEGGRDKQHCMYKEKRNKTAVTWWRQSQLERGTV